MRRHVAELVATGYEPRVVARDQAVQPVIMPPRVVPESLSATWPPDRRGREGGIEIARRAGRYTVSKADAAQHRRIVSLREAGMSIARTAELAGCSVAQIKRVTDLYPVRPGHPDDV